MKKKIVFAIIALSLAVVLLAACGGGYKSTLQQITKLLKVDYSEITLNVTTTTNDIALNGNYTLTFEDDRTIIDYSYDKLNDLSLDGNNADSYLTRVSGRAVVENGVVVEGNTAEQLPEEVNYSGISFKQAFFANYKMTGATFEADVRVPKGFTGNTSLECSNMHVTVMYSKVALSKIAITYVSENGSNVSMTYLFTK